MRPLRPRWEFPDRRRRFPMDPYHDELTIRSKRDDALPDQSASRIPVQETNGQTQNRDKPHWEAQGVGVIFPLVIGLTSIYLASWFAQSFAQAAMRCDFQMVLDLLSGR